MNADEDQYAQCPQCLMWLDLTELDHAEICTGEGHKMECIKCGKMILSKNIRNHILQTCRGSKNKRGRGGRRGGESYRAAPRKRYLESFDEDPCALKSFKPSSSPCFQQQNQQSVQVKMEEDFFPYAHNLIDIVKPKLNSPSSESDSSQSIFIEEIENFEPLESVIARQTVLEPKKSPLEQRYMRCIINCRYQESKQQDKNKNEEQLVFRALLWDSEKHGQLTSATMEKLNLYKCMEGNSDQLKSSLSRFSISHVGKLIDELKISSSDVFVDLNSYLGKVALQVLFCTGAGCVSLISSSRNITLAYDLFNELKAAVDSPQILDQMNSKMKFLERNLIHLPDILRNATIILFDNLSDECTITEKCLIELLMSEDVGKKLITLKELDDVPYEWIVNGSIIKILGNEMTDKHCESHVTYHVYTTAHLF